MQPASGACPLAALPSLPQQRARSRAAPVFFVPALTRHVSGVERVQHPVQRAVVGDLEAAQHHALGHVVHAHVLGGAARQQEGAVGRVGQRGEGAAGGGVLRGAPVGAQPAARDVAPPRDRALELALDRVPKVNLAVQRGRRQLACVGAPGQRQHVVPVAQRLGAALAGEDVPGADGGVPGGGGKQRGAGSKGERHHGALVAGQHVQQAARLERPDVHLEGVLGAGHHDVAAGVDGQGDELRGWGARVRGWGEGEVG